MVVAAVRAQHPQAVYLELEESDQGNFYDGGTIRAVDGKPLGDYAGDDGPWDHDYMALTNLSNGRQVLPFITEDAQGRLGMDLDAAMAYAEEG